MNNDFQSAFELYVEGDGTSKRPRTRSLSSLSLLNTGFNTLCERCDVGSSVHHISSRSSEQHRHSCPPSHRSHFSTKLTVQKTPSDNARSPSSSRVQSHGTHENVDLGMKVHSFVESTLNPKVLQCTKHGVGEDNVSDESDSQSVSSDSEGSFSNAATKMSKPRTASVCHVSQKSRLVVKISKNEFCQLTCIEVEPARSKRHLTKVFRADCKQWIQKGRLRSGSKFELPTGRNRQSSQIFREAVAMKRSKKPKDVVKRKQILKTKVTPVINSSSSERQKYVTAKKCKVGSREIVPNTILVGNSSTGEQRPRRNIIPKRMNDATGLSWREETDLKRALYASLQKQRIKATAGRPADKEQGTGRSGGGGGEKRNGEQGISATTDLLQSQAIDFHLLSEFSGTKCRDERPILLSATKQGGRKSLVDSMLFTRSGFCHQTSHLATVWTVRDSLRKTDGSKTKPGIVFTSLKCDEREQSKTQARAQRKFAHSTPALTQYRKIRNSGPRKDCKLKNVTTEDFLTFLCLRGTDLLPPHMEVFNYSESESLQSFPSSPRLSPSASLSDTSTLYIPQMLQESKHNAVCSYPFSTASKQLIDSRRSLYCLSMESHDATENSQLSSSAEFYDLEKRQKEMKEAETVANTRKLTQSLSQTKEIGDLNYASNLLQTLQNCSHRISESHAAFRPKLRRKEHNTDCNDRTELKNTVPDICAREHETAGSEAIRPASIDRPMTRSRTAALLEKQLTVAKLDKFDKEKSEETKTIKEEMLTNVEFHCRPRSFAVHSISGEYWKKNENRE